MRITQEITNHSLLGREITSEQQIVALIKSEDPFPIDFDVAWEWCGYSRKDVAKKKLLANFTEDVDFQSLRQKAEQRGGQNKESVKLSIDCFKSFGMMAGTQKGKAIRSFFIECEKKLVAIQGLPLGAPLSPLQILEMQVSLMKEQDSRILGVEAKVNLIEAKITTSDQDYFTISGYCRLNKIKINGQQAISIGKACSKESYNKNTPVGKIKDTRYGQVNTYHIDILNSVVSSIIRGEVSHGKAK